VASSARRAGGGDLEDRRGDPAPAKLDGDGSGLTLLAYPSLRFYDGRSAISSWLQEAPDSMTQAVWDAWVEISTETAAKLGVTRGDMVAVKSSHGTIELPAYISPTLHPSAVAIPMGHRYAPYQRPRYVAADTKSVNLMDILPATPDPASGGLAFMSVKVTLTKLGTRRPLAVLQATHDQDDRELAQHVDLGPRASRRARRGAETPHPTLYEEQKYPGPALLSDDRRRRVCGLPGMRDLLPGREQRADRRQGVGGVRPSAQLDPHRALGGRQARASDEHVPADALPALRGRAVRARMSRLRGVPDRGRAQRAGLQPLRGTRYCGNNCPYHVRRFNWFQYEFPTPLEVQLNPTSRSASSA
jgi:molybdopterin-containing oxidoreductase family iron-sulfur binding subunit